MECKQSNGTVEPIRVHTLVISACRALDIPLQQIQKELVEKVVKIVIPEKCLDEGTIYHLFPSEKFVEGSPKRTAYADLDSTLLHASKSSLEQKCNGLVYL